MMEPVEDITAEIVEELFYDSVGASYGGWTLAHKEFSDHGRWGVLYNLVLEKDGEYYGTTHEVPATEHQEIGPQEYHFHRVYPHQVTVTAYRQEPDSSPRDHLPNGLTAFTLSLLMDKALKDEGTTEDAKLLAQVIGKLEIYCLGKMQELDNAQQELERLRNRIKEVPPL